MVVVVLWAFRPLIRTAISYLPLFGINRPAKMTAAETAAALPARMRLGLADVSLYDVRCDEHRRTSDWSPERSGAWDYVCTFVSQPRSYYPRRVKVGVLVRHDVITAVSSQHELEARYIR